MIQSFHTQLQVTLRALREVVAPALDQKDHQALEQLHLSVATLEFMQKRLPYARRYHRMELNHLIGLARQVIEIAAARPAAESLAKAINLGNHELNRPEAEVEDYLIVSRQLRDLISGAVADAVGQPFEDRLDALIVNATEYLLLRERVWCQPLGFELKPQDLPDLDLLLDRQESAASES